MSDVSLQPMPVMTDGVISEGRLVLADGSLVAVLTPVSPADGQDGDQQKAGWFLEAGFGPCSSLKTVKPDVFPDLDAALAWVRGALPPRA